MSEALRALGVLVEPPCANHAAIAEALELPPPPSADEHMAVLGFQLPPYASIYLGAEGMLGGEARDRVAGFWRALGAEPPGEPDHLSVLCAALAGLDRVSDPRTRTARAALYWEHLASWMPPYLAAVRRIGTPFYVAWADTLDAVLAAEADAAGLPPALPLALRTVAGPSQPPADLDALLGAVLAPVQLGAVVTRDDLARCSDALGLGLRAGERRFALRSLLAQDAAGVLRWLAGDVRQQAAAYDERSPIARWWRGRALRAAHWLDGLARDAAEPATIVDQ